MAFRSSMRRYFPLLGFPFAVPAFHAMACTAFTVTRDGHTFIGCNEDAWSINAQVRFEQGRDGQFGAIYFGHYNGSPLRAMIDQMGMNEMGLVFDGLSIQARQVPSTPGLRQSTFDVLMPLVLHTCKDVQEAAALLRTYDRSLIPHAMIFLADHQGGYLIVENDTLIEGHDPWYAVGNWRMGSCRDPDAIPIPRLQAGRALLKSGNHSSVGTATHVLESMQACRKKMGEGTLFSALFEPADGRAHLYFYHDFGERVTFDLKTELAKGDRTIEMAALFGERPEYVALLEYTTPFHQRWLWWAIASVGMVSLLGMLWAVALFIPWTIACIRSRSLVKDVPWLVVGVGSALATFLCGTLLLMEGVFYFGLSDAVDRIHPALVYAPTALLLCVLLALLGPVVHARHRRPLRAWASVNAMLLLGLAYWDLLWP